MPRNVKRIVLTLVALLCLVLPAMVLAQRMYNGEAGSIFATGPMLAGLCLVSDGDGVGGTGYTASFKQCSSVIQRTCVSTGEIAAAGLANVCVTWGAAYADSTYSITGAVYDENTTTMAALTLHHLSSKSTTEACGVILNSDASNARTGTLCLDGAA